MHQEGRVGQMGKECSREPKVIVTLEEGAFGKRCVEAIYSLPPMDPQAPLKSPRPLLFPSLCLATWCPIRPIF